MFVPVKNMAGEQVGEIELSKEVFAAPVSKTLMHQALVRQLANARLGTHDTKSRWEVSGGGKKPWKQKGTGRARQGSIRASQWIGGGVAFGPTPRKYTQSLNKKMQRAALRSALSVKVAAGQLVVVDELTLDAPKTKQMVQILSDIGASQSVLMVLAEKNEPVWRSANNLPKVKTLVSGFLNVRDLLGFDTLLLSKDAIEHLELWLGGDLPVGAIMEEEDAVSAPVAMVAETPAVVAPTAVMSEPDELEAEWSESVVPEAEASESVAFEAEPSASAEPETETAEMDTATEPAEAADPDAEE
jgi:large subunit ribosomal protein L4